VGAYRQGTGRDEAPTGSEASDVIHLKAMRTRGATVARLLLVIVPLVLAACNNGGGGSGY
jgi:predicted small secreted protein